MELLTIEDKYEEYDNEDFEELVDGQQMGKTTTARITRKSPLFWSINDDDDERF